MKDTILRYGTALRIYDNGGRSADRYTILPPRWAGDDWRESNGAWFAITCNSEPFHPQGIGMHCSAVAGSHLGKRIGWADLPRDVQMFAAQTFGNWAPEVKA